MSGILFLKTQQLSALREFYIERIGCEIWLEQADCIILQHGNFLVGLCERDAVEADVMLTFFYERKEDVDQMHSLLEPIATTTPQMNTKYNIYQFFAKDPEGRTLEFQHFAAPVAQFRTGAELLLSRRSVREFTSDDVSEELLNATLELSRWAPTANNSQPYYYKIVRDRHTISWLSKVRGSSSEPIGRAPVAVAICADPAASRRYEQDASIAAYHFILAAWHYGLGTCWIGGLDRHDIKERLDIPQEHHIATVTPVGYPRERVIAPPERRPLDNCIRY
jgi:nitroreductase